MPLGCQPASGPEAAGQPEEGAGAAGASSRNQPSGATGCSAGGCWYAGCSAGGCWYAGCSAAAPEAASGHGTAACGWAAASSRNQPSGATGWPGSAPSGGWTGW
ncbi:hypothetical protein ADK52_32445 [Streptomyces sp. WM6372]|uniref:hypothetical protein n=1 Tax=Streptomyces sp. WM6372 TaxID=1415555 RepID=UPI0006AE2FAA|nr:hypothetical protein [Streptomyces sp. WM6372]KOU17217.1 hypothetical protein ADK52_32445 [Streptomyces sp. WM6372]